ncbi:MAG: TetR/AcrR family transcriptional regulator [Propioniciclava sp.]
MSGDFRSRPRRRGQALESAIIEAAIAELRAVGYSAMTFDAVARRAGAGKVSIYRRWPNRFELALAAAYQAAGSPELPPEPSTLRTDLLVCFRFMAEQSTDVAGAVLRGIVAEALSDDDAARVAQISRGHGRQAMVQILERARQRGEPINAEITPTQLLTPPSLLQNHILTRGQPDEAFLVAVVDEVALPLLTGASAAG